jgi:hypothetical protein
MKHVQADLFAEDEARRNRLTDEQRGVIRGRLLNTLAMLEAAAVFPWTDPLDAVHEENRFEREAARLGDEGPTLWAKFDREMDRLYATRKSSGV